MDSLFEQFLQEKRYLDGVSSKTLVWYRYSYRAYRKVTDQLPNKELLKTFVMEMRKSDLTNRSINNYIGGLKVFINWLHENEHIPELKLSKIKEEQKVLQTFSDQQLGAIIEYKPKSWAEKRLHTLLLSAIDTGCRIEELLTLTKRNVDLDSLVIKVTGKGAKERIVPISLELSKVLFKYLKKHEPELVFCTKRGKPLIYRNMLRNFKELGERLGISGVRVSFHTLRHTFAYNYVKHGGNVLYLQRALGHTDLSMTKRYVNLQTEDLKAMHQRVSQLSRLRS